MVKLVLLVGALCGLATNTFGFQTTAPARRRVSPPIKFQRRLECHTKSLRVASKNRPIGPDVSLQAFGGGSGGFGNNFGKPPPKMETTQDVLQRLVLMGTGTVRQFTSGFMSGYLMGLVWNLIRGPSLTMNRQLTWGLDFGVLSALFAGTKSVTEFTLALAAFRNRKTDNYDDNESLRKRQQKASLWSVVIRNMLLSIYFSRTGGMVKMARLSVLYGGLTYYFVGKQMKRNATMLSGGGAGQPSADAMQQLMQQMMAMQQQGQTQSSPPSSSFQTPVPPPATSTTSTASSSSRLNEKDKVNRENAVDVEFEKVDNDQDGDDKQ